LAKVSKKNKNTLPNSEKVGFQEHCENPWNYNCKNTSIVVTIQYHGQMLPICDACWTQIADSNREW